MVSSTEVQEIWSWREQSNRPTVAARLGSRASRLLQRGPAPSHTPHEGDASPSGPLRLEVARNRTGGVYPVALIENAPGRASLVWSWREESNLQPAVYKTAALPIELRQQPNDLKELQFYRLSALGSSVPSGLLATSSGKDEARWPCPAPIAQACGCRRPRTPSDF